MKIRLWTGWIARITGTAIVVLFLPFYFGYGNPLPFLNPEYTAHDNAWLTAFPFIFIGLILGWWYPRIGGYMVVLAILAAQTVTFLTGYGLVVPMVAPLIVGILFIVSAGQKNKIPKE